jgi:hypothetical protein
MCYIDSGERDVVVARAIVAAAVVVVAMTVVAMTAVAMTAVLVAAKVMFDDLISSRQMPITPTRPKCMSLLCFGQQDC